LARRTEFNQGPTEAVFHAASGNHLLIVGQREEAALACRRFAGIARGAIPKGRRVSGV
jgi:hypothetical protein